VTAAYAGNTSYNSAVGTTTETATTAPTVNVTSLPPWRR
jgi:hypothetical protein